MAHVLLMFYAKAVGPIAQFCSHTRSIISRDCFVLDKQTRRKATILGKDVHGNPIKQKLGPILDVIDARHVYGMEKLWNSKAFWKDEEENFGRKEGNTK